MERTLILIKPDAVQRGLIGEIISRLEHRGLKIIGMKLMQIDEELARRHYAVHEGKPFYEGLINYITASPSVEMCIRDSGVPGRWKRRRWAPARIRQNAGSEAPQAPTRRLGECPPAEPEELRSAAW